MLFRSLREGHDVRPCLRPKSPRHPTVPHGQRFCPSMPGPAKAGATPPQASRHCLRRKRPKAQQVERVTQGSPVHARDVRAGRHAFGLFRAHCEASQPSIAAAWTAKGMFPLNAQPQWTRGCPVPRRTVLLCPFPPYGCAQLGLRPKMPVHALRARRGRREHPQALGPTLKRLPAPSHAREFFAACAGM